MVTHILNITTFKLYSEIVQESDFSDMAYNTAYINDVQNLIAKSIFQHFFG